MPRLPQFRVIVRVELFDTTKENARQYVDNAMRKYTPFASYEVAEAYKIQDGEDAPTSQAPEGRITEGRHDRGYLP